MPAKAGILLRAKRNGMSSTPYPKTARIAPVKTDNSSSEIVKAGVK